MRAVEFCAGAGGQALGLEQAGFSHSLLVDNDPDCCRTLGLNRRDWNVVCADLRDLTVDDLGPIDLLAAGLPCPPFSIAGRQLGAEDERNLFPAAFRLIDSIRPKFVLIENVKGLLAKSFSGFREALKSEFRSLGYEADFRLYNASSFGVSQLRPRVAIVAARSDLWPYYAFPQPTPVKVTPVGSVLADLMGAQGWEGAASWSAAANGIAPTIVGGSKKHGGPDLGPTRAREAWAKLGVNGKSIAEEAPEPGFTGMPRLTPRMVARIQGFPDGWRFHGKKTSAYRQIGNAFPPPVARAIGLSIARALSASDARFSSNAAAAHG